MARQFFFRGKSSADVKKLSMEEFIKMVPSRQRRTIKKGFTEQQKKLLKKIDKVLQGESKKAIKTQCRDMIILPKMVDLIIHVHQGKTYVPIRIMPQMLGMYLGELALTRNRVSHSAPGVGATKSSGAISVK